MKRSLKKLTALSMAAAMAFSLAGCSSGNGGETTAAEAAKTDTQAAGTESTGEPVTLKITWWGGQGRHDYTQKMLDAYTASHPNVTFEAMPVSYTHLDVYKRQTQHHAEPLGAEMFLRAYPDKTPSFKEYPDLFRGLWEEGIKRQMNHKIIWNLGFRGQGDTPFWENDPQYDLSLIHI